MIVVDEDPKLGVSVCVFSTNLDLLVKNNISTTSFVERGALARNR